MERLGSPKSGDQLGKSISQKHGEKGVSMVLEGGGGEPALNT